jgi:hypothetical protein
MLNYLRAWSVGTNGAFNGGQGIKVAAPCFRNVAWICQIFLIEGFYVGRFCPPKCELRSMRCINPSVTVFLSYLLTLLCIGKQRFAKKKPWAAFKGVEICWAQRPG